MAARILHQISRSSHTINKHIALIATTQAVVRL